MVVKIEPYGILRLITRCVCVGFNFYYTNTYGIIYLKNPVYILKTFLMFEQINLSNKKAIHLFYFHSVNCILSRREIFKESNPFMLVFLLCLLCNYRSITRPHNCSTKMMLHHCGTTRKRLFTIHPYSLKKIKLYYSPVEGEWNLTTKCW